MKILVTGAAGFIGSHILPKLYNRGYEVTCLVRSEEKGRKLKDRFPYVDHVVGDTTDPEAVKNLPLEVDYIIHMAATGHVSATSQEAYEFFTSVNEGGTKNLVDHYRESPTLKKFVHFSSTAAMGPAQTPFLDENSPPDPVTPYQKSKLRSEMIVRDAFRQNGFPGVVVRPCMVYGEGGSGEFYKFCRLMKKGVFPKVGRGENLTPLVYAGDVAEGAILAMEKGTPGEIYLLTSKTSIPMDTMHELIIRDIGCKSPYIYVPAFLALAGAYVLEHLFDLLGKEPIVTYRNIRSTVTDRTFIIDKACAQLGYDPQTSFEDGIQRTIDWYKMNGMI